MLIVQSEDSEILELLSNIKQYFSIKDSKSQSILYEFILIYVCVCLGVAGFLDGSR